MTDDDGVSDVVIGDDVVIVVDGILTNAESGVVRLQRVRKDAWSAFCEKRRAKELGGRAGGLDSDCIDLVLIFFEKRRAKEFVIR